MRRLNLVIYDWCLRRGVVALIGRFSIEITQPPERAGAGAALPYGLEYGFELALLILCELYSLYLIT